MRKGNIWTGTVHNQTRVADQDNCGKRVFTILRAAQILAWSRADRDKKRLGLIREGQRQQGFLLHLVGLG